MVPWSIMSHGHTTFNFNFLIWVLFVLGNFLWTIYRRWEFGVYWEEGILLVPQIDPSVPQPVFTITEKAPTRAFS